MKSFQRILFATDFSEAAEPACTLAINLAREEGAELIVFHAYEDSIPYEGGWYVPDMRPELEWRLKQVPARDAGVPVRRILRRGAPAALIVECADSEQCDLIVIGTHGRTGLAHLLLGSVAESVVRTANCPVLTVRQTAAGRGVSGDVASEATTPCVPV